MNSEKPSEKTESSVEVPQNLYRRPNKPKPPEPKQQPKLESATNDAGEVFNAGDKICVTSPWGEQAIAEITGFYQDNSGQAWAQYTPSEIREGWTWETGSIRAALLLKS